MFIQNFKFLTCSPLLSLLILHAGCLLIFLNEKLRSEKREFFFCKLNIKDGNVFYKIYRHDNSTKNIYMFIYKKRLKKCLYRFNKIFSNYQATYQKELYLLFEKSSIFFSQSEQRDKLNPSPPLPLFAFISSLRTSLSPSTTNPLLKRVRWKRWKELMIMLVHSCI